MTEQVDDVFTITRRLITLLKFPFIYSNWPIAFLDRLGLISSKAAVLSLRHGPDYIFRPKTIDTVLINEVWNHLHYNPPGFELSSRDVVVDIGAHIGSFTLYAAYHTSGKIYAFEPVDENFKLLALNTQLNSCHNVEPVCAAVGSGKKAKMYLDPNSTGGHSLYNLGKSANFFQIPTLPLTEVFSHFHLSKIDFLKMDCEGAEYDIFTSTPKNLFTKIHKICLEAHDINSHKNRKFLSQLLQDLGYTVKIVYTPNFYTSMIYAHR